MLRLVTDKRETIKCQKLMVESLLQSLEEQETFTVGFPGGKKVLKLNTNSQIWFGSFEIGDDDPSPRFWNGFGLSQDLNPQKSNNIVVEINIPTTGLNRRVAGMFAINDSNGEVFLLHRGKIGGGRPGIGKEALLSWLKTPFTDVDYEGTTEQAILIGCVTEKKFHEKIYNFISSVKSFKEFVTSDECTEASFLSTEELEDIASGLELLHPKKIKSQTTSFQRSAYVSELAKRKAEGICQLCLEPAPFSDSFGRPFLETHHIVWLSRGGADTPDNTIALCPNCHRKMHKLDNEVDKKSLMSRV